MGCAEMTDIKRKTAVRTYTGRLSTALSKRINTRVRLTRLCAVLLVSAAILTGCTASPSGGSDAAREIFAMDTVMEITCYGQGAEQAAADGEKLIHELDALLSAQAEDSEIGRINASGSGRIDERTAVMIETAQDVYATTEGDFDITIYPLMQLWGFPERQLHVPAQTELSEALALVGSDRLTYDEQTLTLTLGDGQEIDLGGIAKGYTGDALMELFKERGISSAIVSLGGNVQTLGTKPDGSRWRCGIVNPHDPQNTDNLMGVLEVADRAVVTSGAYERYYTDEATGEVYHHILDPHTGMPADSGIISATVVSPYGVLADALSTACYVMGVEKSLEYWQDHGADRFELILMTEDDEVYVTQGLADDFTCNFPVHEVERHP